MTRWLDISRLFFVLVQIGPPSCFATQCGEALFEEKGGIVVIEAESAPPMDARWDERIDVANFTGSSFLEWTGTDYFNSPGNGLREYKVQVHTVGTFRFQWRSRILVGTKSNEHNDAWLRCPDATSFFGQRGSSIVYPGGLGLSPTPNGSSSNGWFKVFQNQRYVWTWQTKTSDHDSHDIYVSFDSPGVYTIQVSGRSAGYGIDRMVLSHSTVSASEARNTNLAETLCVDPVSTPLPPQFGISDFILVDADENSDIPGALDCSPINTCYGRATNFNIRAKEFGNDIKRVTLRIEGPIETLKTESFAPFALFGDNSGNYEGRKLPSGTYEITAWAFDSSDKRSDSLSKTFTVSDTTTTVTPEETSASSTTVEEAPTSSTTGRTTTVSTTSELVPLTTSTRDETSTDSATPDTREPITTTSTVTEKITASFSTTAEPETTKTTTSTVVHPTPALIDPTPAPVDPATIPDTQEPIFLNCGSRNEYFDGENVWLPDLGYVGPGFSVYSTTASINNTDILQEIFKTERFDQSKPDSTMNYSIELIPGYYDIFLYFSEIYFKQAGQRVFDVKLEGSVEIPGLDIVRSTGGINKAHVEPILNYPVVDGFLDIEFGRLKQNPKISGIEIRPTPTNVAPTRLPTTSPPEEQTSSMTTAAVTTSPEMTTTTEVTTTTQVHTTTTSKATSTSEARTSTNTTALPASTTAVPFGISGFVLVDASTDVDIEGAFRCNPACVGDTSSFNIRAETFGSVSSVRLMLSGTRSINKLEGVAPYTLGGDTPGTPPDYRGISLPPGDYRIEAQAFPLPKAQGVGSSIEGLDFTIAE